MKYIPQYPIKVIFFEDDEEEIFYDEIQMVSNLEWFDSREEPIDVLVYDKNNKRIHLVIDTHELITFELEDLK